MSPLRVAGLILAVVIFAFAIGGRRRLRNGDIIILMVLSLGIAVVSATGLANTILDFFDFERGGGQRILGVVVGAVFLIFLLLLKVFSNLSVLDKEFTALLGGLAWERFKDGGWPEKFKGKLAIVIPGYNEADNIGPVLDRMPKEVCGVETVVLVIDDGSKDATSEVAAQHGAAVVRHVINRGQGAAMRTGYQLVYDAGAELVVAMDSDGQHQPEQMERLVKPVVEGKADLTNGSRTLGEADKSTAAREFGIKFFNKVISALTRTEVTDCSNGYRAMRASILPKLVFKQNQFHNSEFLIEAMKAGVPTVEVPVTVSARLSGHSKKPAVLRYGWGFFNAIFRTWLR